MALTLIHVSALVVFTAGRAYISSLNIRHIELQPVVKAFEAVAGSDWAWGTKPAGEPESFNYWVLF